MAPRKVAHNQAGFCENALTGDQIDLTQLPIPRALASGRRALCRHRRTALSPATRTQVISMSALIG